MSNKSGMLLDSREKNVEGFNPNVANDERTPNVTASSKAGYVFIWIIAAIFGVIIIGLPIMFSLTIQKRNFFRTQQEKINESSSGIDVQLKKRRDTLIKLVDATQSSIKFEKTLLTDITSLRNINHFSANDKQNASKLDSAASKILATFENYPNLKTTDTIRDLMQTATVMEGEIAAARRLYNSQALHFNQEIQR
jgi:LemA protein